MLHVNFHVRNVKSNPFKSNQVTKSWGVQGEAECFYYPMYQAKTHRVNGAVFRTTAAWIKKNRKSEMLQDYLERYQITWQFSLSKSPWWGGLYERLIKDVKKTFYKTMGRTSFKYEQVNLW